jgi:hypothetical protein
MNVPSGSKAPLPPQLRSASLPGFRSDRAICCAAIKQVSKSTQNRECLIVYGKKKNGHAGQAVMVSMLEG